MKEAVEHLVVWKEVDVATFLCFGQFVYTGDYCAVLNKAEQTPAAVQAPRWEPPAVS